MPVVSLMQPWIFLNRQIKDILKLHQLKESVQPNPYTYGVHKVAVLDSQQATFIITISRDINSNGLFYCSNVFALIKINYRK